MARPSGPAERTLRSLILVGCALSGLPAAAGEARDDWPEIRGPQRNGVAPAAGLARSWPPGGPPERFRRPLGEAFSGLVVVGDDLCTMASTETHETVVCADAHTGTTRWEVPVDELFVEESGNGPRSTPAVDSDRVYAVSSRGRLTALARADGRQLWSLDLLRSHGVTVPTRGYAPSPLIDGDQLVIEVGADGGGAIHALDTASGRLRWRAATTPLGHSSPVLATLAGVRQYVFAAGDGEELLGLDRRGTILWRHRWTGGAIAMPVVVDDDRVFVSAQLDSGAILLEILASGAGGLAAREVWRTPAMKNQFNASVWLGSHLFGFDNTTLRALEVATGASRWASRGLGRGSLIAAGGDAADAAADGGLLFVLGERGQLVLIAADGGTFRESGRVQALSGKAWTQPTLAHGHLYLRDQDELVAYDVRTGAGPPRN